MKNNNLFRKFLALFLTGTMLAGVGCKDYDDDIDDINKKIDDLTYIIHSGFISGYQNRYGDNLKPPTNVYHRMTA